MSVAAHNVTSDCCSVHKQSCDADAAKPSSTVTLWAAVGGIALCGIAASMDVQVLQQELDELRRQKAEVGEWLGVQLRQQARCVFRSSCCSAGKRFHASFQPWQHTPFLFATFSVAASHRPSSGWMHSALGLARHEAAHEGPCAARQAAIWLDLHTILAMHGAHEAAVDRLQPACSLDSQGVRC
jgi:hypothetical protein